MTDRPRARRGLVAKGALAVCALLALGLASPPSFGRPTLPEPDLSNLAPADREQVERQRALLDEFLSAPDTADATLAAAFGELGQIYFLYDLADVARTCFESALELAGGDFRWHYYLGVLHRREGRFELADRELSRALELRPEDLPAFLHLGFVALEDNRLDDAGEAFRAVLARDEGSAAALYGAGQVAAARGEHEQAAERFRAALAADPGASAVHHPLGMALRRLGDLEGARHHLSQNQHAPVTFADPLIDGLRELLRGARVFLRAGNHAMAAGALDQALGLYRKAVEADPEDPLTQYNLGFALAAKGDRAGAMEQFRRTLELDPANRDAHYNLGLALVATERYAEAAGHFESAYRVDPRDHQAHLDWATALAATGDRQRATAELEALLAEDPTNWGALENLSVLYVNRGDLAGAVALLERLVASEPPPDRELAARRTAARLLGRLGRFEAAAAQLTEVVRAEPEDDEAHFGRAISLVLGESYGPARAALEESLGVRPENRALRHLLARLLAACPEAEVRDGQRAVTLAQAVFQAEPSLDHAETLAMALAEAGQTADASQLQRRVVEELERAGAPPALVARARARLGTYESGQPARAPWKDG